MANRNFANAGRIFAMHCAPVLLDCNFIVDRSNGNGLGIRSLKGPGIANVFMHTSASPGIGNNGILNPNPADGYIIVQLQDNYNRSFSGFDSKVSPLSGSNLLVASAGLSAGLVYIITVVGTTTQAQWQALGVPAGITAAPGVVFVAAATSALGTGAVQVPAAQGSKINSIETLGDPNASLAPVGTPNTGGYIFLTTLGSTGAGGIQQLVTPANGTVISLSFYLSNSSIQVQGE